MLIFSRVDKESNTYPFESENCIISILLLLSCKLWISLIRYAKDIPVLAGGLIFIPIENIAVFLDFEAVLIVPENYLFCHPKFLKVIICKCFWVPYLLIVP